MKSNILWCIASYQIGAQTNFLGRLKWMQSIKIQIMTSLHGVLITHMQLMLLPIKVWYMLYNIRLQDNYFIQATERTGGIRRMSCSNLCADGANTNSVT